MNAFQPNVAGVYFDVPAETYHAAPGLSNSMLCHLDPPARFLAYQTEKRIVTPEMWMGTLVHERVLEPKAARKLAVPPETYWNEKEKEHKPWIGTATVCKEWARQQQAEGNEVIKAEEFDRLIAITSAVMGHAESSQVFANGRSEVSVFADYLGTFCKARMDWVSNTNFLADLKVVQVKKASKREFEKTVYERRYHVQAAYYLDLWNASVDAESRKQSFIFVAVERDAPYLVACYTVGAAMLNEGRETYLRDVETYKRCMAEGVWPGYPSGFAELELPAWVKRKEGYV